jgi:hypothetical protein
MERYRSGSERNSSVTITGTGTSGGVRLLFFVTPSKSSRARPSRTRHWRFREAGSGSRVRLGPVGLRPYDPSCQCGNAASLLHRDLAWFPPQLVLRFDGSGWGSLCRALIGGTSLPCDHARTPIHGRWKHSNGQNRGAARFGPRSGRFCRRL